MAAHASVEPASKMVVAPPRWDVAKALAMPERWFVLFAIVIVFTCEWIDRSLIVVAMEPVKTDLGLTDTQLGAVAAASGWVGVIFVLPIGRLADRWSRRDIIAGALCVWATGTVMSGFCTSFATLCVARGLVGLGTAGFYPVSQSMVADFFAPEERGAAYGWFGAAWMFGYLLGMVGGGWMIELTSWQTTFVALGAPQLFVALAFHLTVPSAKPCQSNAAASDFFGDVARLAQLQTLQALFCASFFSTINGAMDKFLPSFYVRVHHMGIAEVGTWLGIGTGIVAGCGGLIGGRVIDTVYQRRKDPSIWLRVAAVTTLLALPLYVTSLIVPAPYVSLVLRALADGIHANTGIGANSAKMAVVPPHLRSTTAALHEVLYYFGASIGPVFAGGISESLGGANNPNAIRQALLTGSFLPLFYAAFAWWGRNAAAADMVAAGTWGVTVEQIVGGKQVQEANADNGREQRQEEQVMLLRAEKAGE